MLFCSVERAAGAKKIAFCIPKNAIFKVKMVCYEGGFKNFRLRRYTMLFCGAKRAAGAKILQIGPTKGRFLR